MRNYLILPILALLGACATVPGQPPLSVVEKGARAAEIGYVAGVDSGEALVLIGKLDKAKFKELDFKAYTGLIIARAAFSAAEPTGATKPDYQALVERSDDRHMYVIGF